MNSADSYFDSKLENRKSQNMLRQLQTDTMPIDFSSNDYLGFAKQEISISSKGSGGSRLLSGNQDYIVNLEKELATFYAAEDALVFQSGFQANIGLLSALGERSDTYIMDSNIHASMKEGAQLSYAKVWKFKHNNLDDLELKLNKSVGKTWVFIESLYSMSGEISPIKQIVDLCHKYGAFLIVDEAHSNGIFGKNGEGLVSELGLINQVTARVMTFGKAFGAEGAVILGSKRLKSYLVNFCNSMIYSTAPSMGFVNSLHHQLNAIKNASELRKKLFDNIHFFHALKEGSQFSWSQTLSPIQSLTIGEINTTKRLSLFLKKKGISVFPILSPTVPLGKEQIRFCIHSYNTQKEIQTLFNTINQFT